MPRPDHAPLDSLAHELAASADRVRAAAAALRDRASALPWQSPAARAFEQAFGEFLVQLRGLAGHLDSAARRTGPSSPARRSAPSSGWPAGDRGAAAVSGAQPAGPPAGAPRPVALQGGASSILVECDQLVELAGRLDDTAELLARQVLGTLKGLARSLAELATDALDPLGEARLAEAAAACTLHATAGISGCLGLASGLRGAVRAYRGADRLDTLLAPTGRAIIGLPRLAMPLRAGDLGPIIDADPELADAAGWLASLAVLPLPVLPLPVLPVATPGRLAVATGPPRIAGLLATAYPPGRASVRRHDGPTLDADGPPRCAADLLAAVALRGEDDSGGAIDVRLLDGPGGRRVIVDITGTTDWNLDPRRPSAQATDLGTNLRSMANQDSAMSEGVRLALRQSGVRADEPIMLVGHSQGGMVGARLADSLNRSGEFRVTHLVTAGSPIGFAPVPASVSVLSLENRRDVVPQLDGADNPRRSGWLTARTGRGQPSVLGAHSTGAYVQAAADFDADRDPRVARWRAGAAGFLEQTSVRTQVFTVTRG
jgi:hypothetical protein